MQSTKDAASWAYKCCIDRRPYAEVFTALCFRFECIPETIQNAKQAYPWKRIGSSWYLRKVMVPWKWQWQGFWKFILANCLTAILIFKDEKEFRNPARVYLNGIQCEKIKAVSGQLGAQQYVLPLQTFQEHVVSYLCMLHRDYAVLNQAQQIHDTIRPGLCRNWVRIPFWMAYIVVLCAMVVGVIKSEIEH